MWPESGPRRAVKILIDLHQVFFSFLPLNVETAMLSGYLLLLWGRCLSFWHFSCSLDRHRRIHRSHRHSQRWHYSHHLKQKKQIIIDTVKKGRGHRQKSKVLQRMLFTQKLSLYPNWDRACDILHPIEQSVEPVLHYLIHKLETLSLAYFPVNSRFLAKETSQPRVKL